ncbi:MAG: response regulator [Candidatus Liptonbacteria bacterium]|nr:response regulator [Candidatus Liptonbacteria bacterium]
MGKKVLVIEDDRFLSSLMKARLEKEGFSTLQAFDGEEAFGILKQNKPDLIILDLIMPKVSGFELLENISVDPYISKIPVMILSNLGQDSDIEKVKRLGATKYFVKVKTSIDDLITKVKDLLSNTVGASTK